MRERASLLGGTFQLRSRPGKGTRIRIEIPIDETIKNA
jgi:signal transduction histidine kinase